MFLCNFFNKKRLGFLNNKASNVSLKVLSEFYDSGHYFIITKPKQLLVKNKLFIYDLSKTNYL